MSFKLILKGGEYQVVREDTAPVMGFVYWNKNYNQWEFSFSFQKPNWTCEELKEVSEIINNLPKIG